MSSKTRLHVDISKDYGSFKLQSCFETNDLITGLLGASGSGKSLTLKCIAGIEHPDSGCIVLGDRVLFDSKAGINLRIQERRVGYLFQSYALFETMTAKKNILCGLHGVKDRDEREKLYSNIIELLRLQGLENQKPAELSGGQSQRVALARMLVSRPELILLDEPFSALDTNLKESLQPELLQLLTSYGKPVIMVTHSKDEASFMCSHIALIEKGHIIASGPTTSMFDHPQSIEAARILGCKNIHEAKKVSDYIVSIPSLGIEVKTTSPVPEGIGYAGFKDDSFVMI